MKCYICNKELTDVVTDKNTQCKSHGEHILHNAIGGHLISHTILCEECGGAFSQEDSAFVDIFATFLALLDKGDKLLLDRGRASNKSLKGQPFKSNTLDAILERDIVYKDGKVYPQFPFYNIFEEKKEIKIYAEKNTLKHYAGKVAKDLNLEGKEIADYTIKKIAGMPTDGFLELYFTKDKPCFNNDFKRGMIKIAVEFALNNGIAREDLSSSLKIDSITGRACINYEQVSMFPYCALNLLDIVYEKEREQFEKYYPSHSIKLFSQTYSNDSKVLYCYIDLFSTFQYYVQLNGDYKGKDVEFCYGQRLLKRDKSLIDSIDQMDYSDLDIVIRENYLDREALGKMEHVAMCNKIKNILRKRSPEFDLIKDVASAYNRVFNTVKSVFINRIAHNQVVPLNIHSSTELIINKIIDEDGLTSHDVAIMEKFMNQNQIFRSMNIYTDDEGNIKNTSSPDECIKLFVEHSEILKEYTTVKFTNLRDRCFRIERHR